jgi:hypothetical protein
MCYYMYHNYVQNISTMPCKSSYLTLTLLKPKVISLCNQYAAGPTCMLTPPTQCWPTITLYFQLDIPKIDKRIDRAGQVNLRNFSRVWVKLKELWLLNINKIHAYSKYLPICLSKIIHQWIYEHLVFPIMCTFLS